MLFGPHVSVEPTLADKLRAVPHALVEDMAWREGRLQRSKKPTVRD